MIWPTQQLEHVFPRQQNGAIPRRGQPIVVKLGEKILRACGLDLPSVLGVGWQARVVRGYDQSFAVECAP
jgi:hypothetical protein